MEFEVLNDLPSMYLARSNIVGPRFEHVFKPQTSHDGCPNDYGMRRALIGTFEL